MKVAVSTENDMVSAHFGRCPIFTIAEVDGGKVLKKEIVENPAHQPGMVPEFLRKLGVNCVVAGGMGARANEIFRSSGIRTLIVVQGKVDEVLRRLAEGKLEPSGSLCEGGHDTSCKHHNK